jgi:FtsZ-binding cell division protein ZapB
MNKYSIIDRIRKLFALGDRNKNPNEGEVKTALAMASKLMKEHNLSLSEIDLEKQKEDIIEEHTSMKSSISFWERKLADMVGKLFDCESIIAAGWKRRGWIFVGFEQEAKLASKCYEYLDNVIRIMANTMSKHKLDFYAGITDRLQERINEEIKLRTPVETSKCTAIVCCKDKLIQSYKKKNMKLTMEHRSKPNIDEVSPDYYKGYLIGGTIDLQNKPKIK